MQTQAGNILVVDDSPTIRLKLSFDLQSQGHSVTTAQHGREALTMMQAQAYLHQLQAERERSESLLFNVLPKPVAERLKQGETVIADSFEEVSVLFADIVDFTELSMGMTPTDLVVLLNDVFCAFDYLAARHGLEKIKTTGDAYMVVGGLFDPRADYVAAIADMALDMRDTMALFSREDQRPLNVRIGFHMGPVVAGVLGANEYSYDLWGDTVNTASRMESHGLVGKIQVTHAIYKRLRDRYIFEERGPIPIKNKGRMQTYFLVGKRENYEVISNEYEKQNESPVSY